MRIKCPHCNGKGFSEINSAINMTCGWCMGQGELDLEIVPTEPQTEAEIEKKWENTVWDTDVYLDDLDGKEPMTNEEWFCQLQTEEKAKYIAKSMFFYDSQFGLTMVEALRKSIEYEDGLNETIEHDVVEWLKQPHTERER